MQTTKCEKSPILQECIILSLRVPILGDSTLQGGAFRDLFRGRFPARKTDIKRHNRAQTLSGSDINHPQNPYWLGDSFRLVEPLLHFAVPFASLRAIGLEWRKALFVSIFALVPDLDVLFHIHRSVSHSFVMLTIVTLPILAIFYKNKTITTLTLLAALGVSTHLVLDIFGAYTPLLWPISNQSIEILTSLDLHMGSLLPYFTLNLALLTRPSEFVVFQSLDAPLITGEGLAISLVLLVPCLIQLIRGRAVTLTSK